MVTVKMANMFIRMGVLVWLCVFTVLRVEARGYRGNWHRRRFPRLRIPNISIPDRVNQWNYRVPFRRFLSQRRCTKPVIECDFSSRYRTIDGSCNNKMHPEWGTAGYPFRRLLNAKYDKVTVLVSVPRIRGHNGGFLPGARKVSQAIHVSDAGRAHVHEFSNMHQTWGQFLDHDLTKTPNHKQVEGCCDNFDTTKPFNEDRHPCFSIRIREDDRYFQNRTCMEFKRSVLAPKQLTCPDVTGQQMNSVSSYIDASHVYGDAAQLVQLRAFLFGQLKTSGDDMLPLQTKAPCEDQMTLMNLDNTTDFCFVSGDPRVNQHPALSTLHVVFHRLHNLIAKHLNTTNPAWDDEMLFQEARKIVGAIMQIITYKEFLPGLVGTNAMNGNNLHYAGTYFYDPHSDATILNEFATAAFRYGHSQVPIMNTVGSEKILVDKMFNRPHMLKKDHGEGLTRVLEGILGDHIEQADRFFNLGMTDRLFELFDSKYTGLDLASLNIQRGRDHGLPSFNDYREICGRRRIRQPTHTVNQRYTLGKLLAIYNHVDDIDLFTGGLSERRSHGSLIGPTFNCIIAEVFERLKSGDRFWYENTESGIAFTPDQIAELKKVTLSSVLCQTTSITHAQDNAMKTVSDRNALLPCEDIPSIDFSKWEST